jgi:hypothetical protein
MKYLKRQEGMIIPLVIGLVVLVIVVVGVALSQSQHAKPKANTATNSPTPTAVTQASSSPVPTVAPTASVFTVKELAIQFTTTSDLKDLVYTIRDLGGGLKAADFSTTPLIGAGQSCTSDQSHSLLGSIFLSTDPGVSSSEKVKQVGNQYLYYSHPQAACSNSGSVSTLTASFRNALNSTIPAQ